MAFRVKVSPQAEQDAEAILEWLISEGAGDAGLRWFGRLKDAITSLAEMPRRCELAPENASVPFELRQLLYARKANTYRILFTIENETVHVLHIRHGRVKKVGNGA